MKKFYITCVTALFCAATCMAGDVVTFEEFEVKDLWMDGTQKRASVSFVVYNDDTYTPARIDLVYEDNRWLIDNFHNLRYMLDLRNCMWDYLLHDIV